MKVHFITGFSRAGTTWMCQSLNAHSDVFAFGETAFWGRNYIGDQKYTLKDLQNLILKLSKSDLENGELGNEKKGFKKIAAILNEVKCPSDPSALFDLICSSLSEEHQTQIVVEKTPHHINHVDRIRKYYPDSKIIIMDRDVKGFYRSYKNIARIKEGEVRRRMTNNFHPLGVIMVYKKYKRSIKKFTNWDNTHYISFDEIKMGSDTVLKDVQEFLGIQVQNINVGKANSSFKNDKIIDLSTEDRIWIRLLTEQKDLNLTKRELLLSPLILLGSLMKLPIWAFHVVNNVRQVSAANPFSYLSRLIK